jgi:hypothetical protein
MKREELLSKTNIPKEYYDFCYIKDGVVYPPLIENEKVVKTGKERYDDKFNKPAIEEKLTIWQKIKRKVKLK